jgi:hypothetical protein
VPVPCQPGTASRRAARPCLHLCRHCAWLFAHALALIGGAVGLRARREEAVGGPKKIPLSVADTYKCWLDCLAENNRCPASGPPGHRTAAVAGQARLCLESVARRGATNDRAARGEVSSASCVMLR